jgi:hypothetical protein
MMPLPQSPDKTLGKSSIEQLNELPGYEGIILAFPEDFQVSPSTRT